MTTSAATNFLWPDAVHNGRSLRLARYFAQTTELPGAVAVVALLNATDWRAYIGAAAGWLDYDGAAHQVADWGVKLEERDARHFFPEVDLPYDLP